jgi:hypothetical protein
MDGAGVFTHQSGRVHKGAFKRNYFQLEKTFVNPLDDEKKQAKNIKVYDETVLSQKEKQIYDRRTRVYKVQSE